MSGLYPTPNRLALLADVKAGHVYRQTIWGGTDGLTQTTYDRNRDTGRRCTADMREMDRAGWVDLHPVIDIIGRQRWQINAVGEAVLARPMHPDSAACHACYDAQPDQYLRHPTLCEHRIAAAVDGAA